jgi:hypothetical protein
MIRAGMAPVADVQQIALSWLENHFETYGDISPNSDIVKLNINFKSDVYVLYKKETQSNGKFVKKTRFYELWNVIFPNCLMRPWCNIPGKCETCFNIDKARRQSDCSYTQKMLQQCHAIHRCGLFNLERKRLYIVHIYIYIVYLIYSCLDIKIGFSKFSSKILIIERK